MWIGRNLDGSVYGLWTTKQPRDADHPRLEEVDETHPDVMAFRSRPRPVRTNTLEARVTALEEKVRVA